MKLHRIRVTNLNSLYGEQSLDLDVDLHGASLFLIQGPTGSGKSTLMDAVSLALFGTTPRLDGLRSEKDVAEQVMSRGTGVAIAELEFSKVGRDGARRRYRACWKARRARENPDGNMQGTERSMERRQADGSWSLEVGSHKAKDYDPVFAEVLEGFTPSDFQRSMLLAQGQFDAMLHAKPEERAAILERLTDTGDYQRLGERAARMRGAWEGRLAKRKAHRDAIAPLSGEELAAAKAALVSEAEELKALDTERDRLQGALDWLSRRSTLEGDLTAAREAVAAVEGRRAAAADTLAALAAHDACAEAFVAIDRCTEADEALTAHQAIQEAVEASLPGLAEAVGAADEALEGAQGAWSAADEALEALRGPATQASAARSQQVQARTEAEGAQKGLAVATQRHGEAQQALEGATAARTAAGEALGRAMEALGAQEGGQAVHQALAALQSQGAALRTRQDALARGRADVASRGEKLVASEGALSVAKAAHEAAWEATVRPTSEAATEAREALRSLAGAVAPDDLVRELRRSIEAAQAHREALKQVQVALTEVAERRSDHGARQGSVREAEAAHQNAQEAQSQAVQGVEAAREGERLADARLAPLQRIADLGDRRKQLTEGEPCPLCGSGDHPFVHDPAQRAQAEAIQVEVDKAREALQVARGAREAADRAHTQAVSAVSAAASRLEGARAEAQRAQEALTAAQGRAREAMGAAGHFVELGPEALAGELGQAEAQREALSQRLEQLEAARQRERGASDAMVAAEKAHATEAHRLANEAARLAEAREQLDHRTESLDADQAALAEGQEQLRAALHAVGVDAPALHDGLAQAHARALGWKQAHDAHAQAIVAHDKAEAAHRSATASLAQAERLRVEATASLAQREAALVEAQALAGAAQRELERVWSAAAALDGPDALPRPGLDRAPAELVAFQADRVAALHDRHAAARRHRDQARQALTQAQARQATLLEAEGRLKATAAERRAALQVHLQDRSLADVAALAARRLTAEAHRAASALRDQLHTAHTQATARSQALTEQLARHDQERPALLVDDADAAPPTPDALAADLQALSVTRQAAQDRLDAARTTVDMAARDQAALAAAQAALADDTAAAQVWLTLHELIGVGDGKRFKLFAQALNLDQLLVRANRHLEHLNERYHLVSVRDDVGLPTLDFEVSDRWRPGTTRSLKTLSGGESFLVSLALALGLSDLRTSSMPVETLLLDEGFGTLDPATLDTALAALQQLQASGRQVGLISHVVGLQERIEARVRVEPLGEGRSRVVVG